MQSFINYHLKKYPLMTTQDIVKLLYQNHFGPGHFISDIQMVKDYYANELKVINNNNNSIINLYEHIGNNFIRVNMVLFHKHFNDDDLIYYFYNSSKFDYCNNDLKNQFINQLQNINNDGFLNNYDYTNVHHSSIYNQAYHPHYRVINTKYLSLEMRIFQLQNYLDNINNFQIIALEGKCASGKSTIINRLKDITIIDVDEFFLRKELKTESRLNEIGGNIDYDLYEECLKKIKPNSKITYTIFDCQTQTYKDKTISIGNKVLLVGVYSYHQNVRKYIDKLCYLIVDEQEQLNRLKQRSLYLRFINEWVPLENKYYDSYDFIANGDIII